VVLRRRRPEPGRERRPTVSIDGQSIAAVTGNFGDVGSYSRLVLLGGTSVDGVSVTID
jgi:hypothetical protein